MKNFICLLLVTIYCNISFAQIIDIPDANFKNALVNSKCVDIDGDNVGDKDADENNDGELDKSEAEKVWRLFINSKSISNLSGIEFFTTVEYLNCAFNQLISLDVTLLTKLKTLTCNSNQLTSLDVSKLTLLRYLNCSGNQLVSLEISNLDKLEVLYCSQNLIKTLHVSKLSKLFHLSCWDNQLTSLKLIELPSLEILDCYSNQITSLNLNNLPLLRSLSCSKNQLKVLDLSKITTIKNLACSENLLSSLEVSNLASLESLSCYSNSISHLPISHLSQMKDLNCSNNNITSLEIHNLNNLEKLRCGNNQISSLTIKNLLPLKYLDCSGNQLTSLELSSLSNLESIYCTRNQIINLNLNDLPSLETLSCYENLLISLNLSNLPQLVNLTCYSNPLIYLFAKTGKKFEFLYLSQSIQYVCTDEINLINFKTKVPNAEVNSYCSFTPGTKFYSIFGRNKFELILNHCNDNSHFISSLIFEISKDSFSWRTISKYDGSYFIPVQEGTHTIKPILENPNYFNISPDSITVTFPSTFDTIIQNFCITPKDILRQTELTIIPTTAARPGFEATYKVVLTNKGNQVENGILNFSFEGSKMDFVSSDVTPFVQADNYISWEFKDLLPFETKYYFVTLNVNSPAETPAVNAGDVLQLSCSILDNVFSLNQEVVGSFDPNDKTCLEGKTITPEQVGKYVHYLIRFENTGNYAAENIVVKDVIDESTFDISTLQITDASHEAWARIDSNIVEFIFEKIQLPFDDATNDGYIAFKIKTKPTLILGNELKNEANIYFDYNLPILTNKTSTTIALPVVNTNETLQVEVSVFPNPVHDILHFSTKEKINKVEIFDINGRLVQVSNVVNGSVNVERLGSGAYLVKITSQHNQIHTKMIKI